MKPRTTVWDDIAGLPDVFSIKILGACEKIDVRYGEMWAFNHWAGAKHDQLNISIRVREIARIVREL
jgi:hypothetical protein